MKKEKMIQQLLDDYHRCQYKMGGINICIIDTKNGDPLIDDSVNFEPITDIDDNRSIEINFSYYNDCPEGEEYNDVVTTVKEYNSIIPELLKRINDTKIQNLINELNDLTQDELDRVLKGIKKTKR